jgi:hypothetical protein
MGDERSGAPSVADGLASRGLRLRLDAAAAEAFEHFERAGVSARLLKGRSIADWLYGERDLRPQFDCDFLIAPSDLVAAEDCLGSLGYRRSWDDRQMPSWWQEHAGAWVRERDGAVLDLHRTLPGVGVDPDRAWRALSRDPATTMVAGRKVLVLGLPARALHVVLHAAHHGVVSPPIDDLQRALRTADHGLWRAAGELARELDALDAFTAGLSLDPDGVAVSQELDLPARVSTEAALRASSPPPLALGFEQLASARGTRARVAILARKVVPPAEFVRHWDPRAANSTPALVRAYLRRPLWLLWRAPRGLRVWLRARAFRS